MTVQGAAAVLVVLVSGSPALPGQALTSCECFYSELANMNADGELKTMLLKIANEELKHKEKMEYLYSNTAFPQTSGG